MTILSLLPLSLLQQCRDNIKRNQTLIHNSQSAKTIKIVSKGNMYCFLLQVFLCTKISYVGLAPSVTRSYYLFMLLSLCPLRKKFLDSICHEPFLMVRKTLFRIGFVVVHNWMIKESFFAINLRRKLNYL